MNKILNITLLLLFYIISLLLVIYQVNHHHSLQLYDIIHHRELKSKEVSSQKLVRPLKDNLPEGIVSFTDKIGSTAKKTEEVLILFALIFIFISIIRIVSLFFGRSSKIVAK